MRERTGRLCQVAGALIAISTSCTEPPSSVPSPSAAPLSSSSATATPAATTGTTIMYRAGQEIGRETFVDDGKTLQSDVTVAGNKVHVSIDRSGEVRVGANENPRVYPLPEGVFALENGSFQAYALIAERFPSPVADRAIKVYLPSLDKTLDAQVSISKDGELRRVAVMIANIEVSAWVNATGHVVRGAVPAQGVEARPAGEPLPKPEQRAAPADVTEESVSLEVSGGVLSGSLWLPKDPPARLAVVLMIAGSGPTDRDGNNQVGLRTDAYRKIAAGLAEQGVASLRFDKRGIGASTTTTSEAELTLGHFAADAVALHNLLKSDPRFSRVIVAGHSEGGLVASLSTTMTEIDGLVLLASPGRTIDKILREQLASKVPETMMRQVDRILADVRAGKPIERVPEGLESLFRPSVTAFLKSEMDFDPVSALKKYRGEVVVIQGQHDAQISVADAERLGAARPGIELVLLAKSNHVFCDEASAALPQASYTDPKQPLSSGLIEPIVGLAQR